MHYRRVKMAILRKTVSEGIWILELNRPKAHNALNSELTASLLAELDTVKTNPDCRVVVLHGNGPSFCSGADIKEFGGFETNASAANERANLTMRLHSVFNEVPQPIL